MSRPEGIHFAIRHDAPCIEIGDTLAHKRALLVTQTVDLAASRGDLLENTRRVLLRIVRHSANFLDSFFKTFVHLKNLSWLLVIRKSIPRQPANHTLKQYNSIRSLPAGPKKSVSVPGSNMSPGPSAGLDGGDFMRTKTRAALYFVAAYSFAFASVFAANAEGPPEWAFVDTPTPQANALPPDDGKIRSVPDTTVQLSIPQIRNFYSPPDWHPEDHPTMPPLVAHGVNPGIYACGYCHLPTGNGRPENANIAGLPADYIINQVKDMASGRRTSSLPKHFPQELMLKLAGPAADSPGLAEAAAYFAAIKPKAVYKVVETATIPKVEIYRWVYKTSEHGGTEPIGGRLVELPANFEDFENRDGRTTYTAYVPPGSIAKGEALAKTGKCADCHGPGLTGLKDAPPIAGRSPGYIARQLYDFKSGARNGAGAALMKPAVAQLTNDDLVAIAAFLASLEP